MKDLERGGIDKEQDYKGMNKLYVMGVKSYKRAYEKYKSVVEDYSIDLIICDLLMNEACIDTAHTLKKPVVIFVSCLQSNYLFFFFLLFEKKNLLLKNFLF